MEKLFSKSPDEIPLPDAVGIILIIVFALSISWNANPIFAYFKGGHYCSAESTFAEEDAEAQSEDVLWLARAIYSETKASEEQILVAWVIRNRVESSKYPNTYREVVLEPNQFSGLSPGDEQYHVNIGLGYDFSGDGWDSAVEIAQNVYYSDGSDRPISEDIMHFYSPISVKRTPDWAHGVEADRLIRDPKNGSVRFAFYSGIK